MDETTVVNSRTSLDNDTYAEMITLSKIYQGHLSVHKSFNLSTLIQENLKPNLTGYTLSGDDKINFRSDGLFFIDDKFLTDYEDIEVLSEEDNNYSVTFFHLGSNLSGHEGIVHGGLLATLLDELTCRLAFQNFHSKKGVTANLNINYRKPCFVNSKVMIKCEVIKKLGRKCWIKGSVYNMDTDDLLTDCECLVIEPRWVKDL